MFSNFKLNVNYYTADSDKDQYILVKESNEETKTKNKRSPLLDENGDLKELDRRIIKRKFQVRGHWHKYWVGKRGDQHIEVKWIAPYYKNKDLQFSIIKHYRFSSK